MNSLQSRLQVDQICREFERQWSTTSAPPQIECFSARLPVSDRDHALQELLATELMSRMNAGETPIQPSYEARFPGRQVLIDAAFHDVANRGVALRGDGPGSRWPHQEALGDYHLLREIGRGGMGIVFEARHAVSGCRVAVKALIPQLADSSSRRRWFDQEFQTSSKLQHPNIVDMLERGEHAGVHFIAMRYVDGVSLEKVIAEQAPVVVESMPPPSRRRYHRAIADLASPGRYRRIARIGVQISDALEYAHQHGVTHCDVKPSNILLDEGGKAWLTDFGLAQHDDLTPSGLAPGNFMGTLRYLPPEWLNGHACLTGDVYSLGLVLYELLTLRPAYQETSDTKLVDQIVNRGPRLPRDVNADVPHDLQEIVVRSVAIKPQDRYSNVAELRRDLERFLNLESPQARPSSTPSWSGAWRHVSTNWLLIAIAFISLVMLFSSWQLASRYGTDGSTPLNVPEPEHQDPWQGIQVSKS